MADQPPHDLLHDKCLIGGAEDLVPLVRQRQVAGGDATFSQGGEELLGLQGRRVGVGESSRGRSLSGRGSPYLLTAAAAIQGSVCA